MKPFGKTIFLANLFLSLVAVQAQNWLTYGSYSLAAGTATNGQFQFVLNGGEARANYLIESSSNLVDWIPVATNRNFGSNWFVTDTATYANTYYRAARDPIPLFGYAMTTRDFIDMNGNGVAVDNFNSHYPSQSLNGHYNGYSGTNGDVACQGGIVNLGRHTITGDLYLGFNAVFISSPNGNVLGTIIPDSNFAFPAVSLPTTDTNGNIISWTLAPGNGPSHTFTNSGYYMLLDNGSITINPGVVVTLDVKVIDYSPAGMTLKGGTSNACTVVMYQESGSLNLNVASSGGATDNRAENFVFFGMPGVTNINLNGNGTFVGVIYAPQADTTVNTGGFGLDFIGAITPNSLLANGGFRIHYDDFLRTIFLR